MSTKPLQHTAARKVRQVCLRVKAKACAGDSMVLAIADTAVSALGILRGGLRQDKPWQSFW